MKTQSSSNAISVQTPALPLPGLSGAALLGSLNKSGGLLSRAWRWIRERQVVRSCSRRLHVAATASLGEKRFVAVVQMDGLEFLVGGGATNVVLLAQLNAKQQFNNVLEDTISSREEPKPEPARLLPGMPVRPKVERLIHSTAKKIIRPAIDHFVRASAKRNAKPSANPAIEPVPNASEPVARVELAPLVAAKVAAVKPAPKSPAKIAAEPRVRKVSKTSAKPSAKPAVKPAVDSAVRAARKPASTPVHKTVAKPAVKAVAKSSAKPAAKPVKATETKQVVRKVVVPPFVKPQSKKTADPIKVADPVEKPAAKRVRKQA